MQEALDYFAGCGWVGSWFSEDRGYLGHRFPIVRGAAAGVIRHDMVMVQYCIYMVWRGTVLQMVWYSTYGVIVRVQCGKVWPVSREISRGRPGFFFFFFFLLSRDDRRRCGVLCAFFTVDSRVGEWREK